MSDALNKQKASLSEAERALVSSTQQRKEDNELVALGYEPELRRNRSLYTILFQVLAITAVPFGEGTALTSAIYGGGQLAYFVGWIVVCLLDHWSFQLLPEGRSRTIFSFITGWVWLIGNITICLSVNFGTASLIAGTATIYHPDWLASDWQLLLIFYAVCLGTFLICAFGNRLLPYVDAVASVWNGLTILIVCVALSVTANAGRHSVADALANYDKSFSGWGNFTFFIGLLPTAYTFSAIGMITSMAEEVADPARDVPTALSLVVPISGVAGLFFILPICFTDILNAPQAQAMPYVFHTVMGTPGGGLALMFFLLGVAVFCCISISTAASRTLWAFARDGAIPFSSIWSKLIGDQVPLAALALLTVIQMLLGLVNLGSTSAFTAFASCGVIALAAAYAIVIAISLSTGRKAVSTARWRCPSFIGYFVNVVSIAWVAFQLVLFSMPAALPVTVVSMNYASVVLVGFMFISFVYYVAHGRKGMFASIQFVRMRELI
ncbi:putative amino-acid permease C15C4.04c [Metarhizium anisopliae]